MDKSFSFKDAILLDDKLPLLAIGTAKLRDFAELFLRGFASASNITCSSRAKKDIISLIISAKVAIIINNDLIGIEISEKATKKAKKKNKKQNRSV